MGIYKKNGVPQGSILGPLLFTVLVSDISESINSGKYHTYADDVQWYIKFKPEDGIDAFETANTVMTSIVKYSNDNFLKLNTDKTKYIVIGSPGNLKKTFGVSTTSPKTEWWYSGKEIRVKKFRSYIWQKHAMDGSH